MFNNENIKKLHTYTVFPCTNNSGFSVSKLSFNQEISNFKVPVKTLNLLNINLIFSNLYAKIMIYSQINLIKSNEIH